MNTNDLYTLSRARFEHAAARRALKEKYQAKMIFAHAGGMWRAGPDLHAMISTCGQSGPAVFLDLYDNPIKVDAAELLSMSQERWNEQMNAWLIEYQELNKQR